MWDVQNARHSNVTCLGYRMFVIWDFCVVRRSGCEMWDTTGVRYLGCGISWMCSEYGLFEKCNCDVWRYAGC